MAYQVKFEFARPLSPRVVDIPYLASSALVSVRITAAAEVRVTSDGSVRVTYEPL